jgi:hypothetical protein
MKAALLALLISLFPQTSQRIPYAFPREGAKQLIDNDRVLVWEVLEEKGKGAPPHRHPADYVIVELADAAVKTTSATGEVRMTTVKKGHVGGGPKNTADQQETTSDTPRHSIVIELKDFPVVPLQNRSGYPNAFPREGAKKVLETERVVAWDYSWTPGKPTAMHFHDKDVVVVYLDNGELSSTTPDGKTTVNSYAFGDTRFNARNRAHSELLTKGSQRVIAIELKP